MDRPELYEGHIMKARYHRDCVVTVFVVSLSQTAANVLLLFVPFTTVQQNTEFAGSQYVPLLRRSWQLFEELQESTGIPCLHQTGCLGIGSHLLKDCQAACETHSLEYTLLNAEEVLEQFPGYDVKQPVRLWLCPSCAWIWQFVA